MPTDHPFQLLFETLGRVPLAHAESVNRRAFEILCDTLSVPIDQPGRCIMLRAPRAGHGKTHLLSRVQHQLGATSEFIPLHAASGCRIDAASVADDTLRRLVRQLPASGGITVLDLVTRRLFASALQPLVASGEVPCQDREGALTALRARPIETFDFHHPNAVTAHWAAENFSVLSQRLSLELAQRADLPVSDVSFWVDALFRYSSAPLENPSRVRDLAETVHCSTGAEKMEHLVALLGLLTLLTRVVLIADDLEGFSTDETAALRLAAFLGSLRQAVERVDVILSLNRDVWENAFLPRLSGGLADRLSEVMIELEPLTEAEMTALLDSRAPGLGARILERIDIFSAGSHPRGLIRAAGIAWVKASSADAAPASLPVAVPTPEFEPTAVPVPPIFVPAPPVEEEIQTAVATPETEPGAPELQPAIETQQFVAVDETEPVAEEPPISWPPPQFSPPEEWSSREPERGGPLEDPFVEPPGFSPEAASASYAPPEWHEALPASTPFAPDPWKSQGVLEVSAEEVPQPIPQVDSPFQKAAAAEMAPSPFVPATWEESPFSIATEAPAAPADASPFFAAPRDEPAQTAAPTPESEPAFVIQPVPEAVITASAPPGEITPAPPASDTDRVDDLLRQFRERYGRGSL